MARILYTVCGVGLGHCMRSTPVIEELERQGHQILLSSYSIAFDFLKKKFESSKTIQLFDILEGSENDELLKIVMYEVPIEPKSLGKNFLKLLNNVKKFRPDIIISDFDLYSSIIGFLLDIPVTLISNTHISEYYPISLDLKDKINYSLKDRAILYSFPRIDHMILLGFVKPKSLPKKVSFFFYPLREEITEVQVAEKNFFLAYFSEKELEKMLPLLKSFKQKKFVVFTRKKMRDTKNIRFKPLDKKEFAKDFAICKGVLSHGGITSISEALFLKKPVYLFVKKSFFERYYNSRLVAENNFGHAEYSPTANGLKHFFSNLKNYKKGIKKSGYAPENKKMAQEISRLIAEYSGKE
ncbi:MAG: glycosyltransferase family protein [archaeon]